MIAKRYEENHKKALFLYDIPLINNLLLTFKLLFI